MAEGEHAVPASASSCCSLNQKQSPQVLQTTKHLLLPFRSRTAFHLYNTRGVEDMLAIQQAYSYLRSMLLGSIWFLSVLLG